MNYGETIAYLFLRFNGFFPLSNFVLHLPERHPLEGEKRDQNGTADTDVLAIRLPHVYEEIGGHTDDWAPYLLNGGFRLIKKWLRSLEDGLSVQYDIICVINSRRT